MAIQLIINREFGSTNNENALQGSYYYEALTDIVEDAVLKEFERLSDRGGVLGAMELQYQRTKIQEESLYYETKKHDGSLPIVGVNTFLNEKNAGKLEVVELRRATKAEKMDQIESVRKFQKKHTTDAGPALIQLQKVALAGGNIFEELMEVVKVATLGQITEALYSVGGEYRRNM
jgi:methylmalonyl-CoA mutase